MDIIHELETAIGKKSRSELLPIQPGDLSDTHSDVTLFNKDFGFKASTPFKSGVKRFVDWYQSYYFGRE